MQEKRTDTPAAGARPEAWRAASRDENARARERLRKGVEEALVALGQGFLAHPENALLRTALKDGSLGATAYFQQLLRLIYRLLFVLAAEERGLLHPGGSPDAARALYARDYSFTRLREASAKPRACDRSSDSWEATKTVFRALDSGEPRLALPALGGIFDPAQCPALDAAKLDNRALLLGVFRLTWRHNAAGPERIAWHALRPEELGRIYEGLLERVPRVTQGGHAFEFATGSETKGHTRKTTGSYYTPDSLVQMLLDSTLEPVIESTLAAHPDKPAAALLELAILDPACGSGHFLLAAARRLAGHIARRQARDTPTAAQYRSALRRVVRSCIYGVDLDSMAVELCRVSLWMEAAEPGLPLTFVDAHIRHGNALLGTSPALMAKGIADAAWDAIDGDDKQTAAALRKRNNKDAHRQDAPRQDAEGTRNGVPDGHEQFVADAWCAAFVWPKQPGPLAEAAPTDGLWRRIRDGQARAPALLVKTTEALAKQYQFLHWHLAFPQAFARGGFDVVLGNPPWERVKLQEQEFFASRSDEIAQALHAAARKRLIDALARTNPSLWHQWRAACREAEGRSHFVRQSGRYPLCGRGDVNAYALFAEHNTAVLAPNGRAGFIVPPGIATDDTTKAYFQELTSKSRLVSLYEFENEEFLFPGIDHRVRFIVITVAGAAGIDSAADICFGNRRVAALADRDRHFSLAPADFAMMNPNTRTCPTFRSRRDAGINLALYRRAGVLWRDGDPDGNPWGLRLLRMFDMANDSALFHTRAELEAAGWEQEGNRYILGRRRMVPLVEAKMIQHFDHRFGTYEGQTEAQANRGKLPELGDGAHADPCMPALPRYWIDESEMEARLEGRWQRGWLLGWRDICRSTDQRTVIASLLPRAAVGHTTPLMLTDCDPRLVAALVGNLSSFALDYTARQKVGGTHLTYGYLKQLPVLAPATYTAPAPWAPETTVRDWLLPRVLELTFTAWDLEAFARDCGYGGPPFRWQRDRRFLLWAELDAAFFHLYGLSRDDAGYILDTFPVVRKNDEKAWGEHRTRRVILEAYDALAEAIRSGRSYRSLL